jgi:hypothetical protein
MNKDMCSSSGRELPLLANMLPNGTRGPGGSQRLKAQYVAYTDATFTERKVRTLTVPASHDALLFSPFSPFAFFPLSFLMILTCSWKKSLTSHAIGIPLP